MADIEGIGRLLLVVGLSIAALGLLLTLVGKVPFLGRLPGDILIQRDGFSCWFPIVTFLLLSLLLSVLLTIVTSLLRK